MSMCIRCEYREAPQGGAVCDQCLLQLLDETKYWQMILAAIFGAAIGFGLGYWYCAL